MKKILIIEDDQIVANIYRNKFSVEGSEVDIATDGAAGLEAIRSFQPDAVVLDLMMPRMTGVELMQKVRAEPGFQKLPIIVFSNTYMTNLVQQAWKAGATKCLSKASCSPKQLLEVIRGTFKTNGSANGASALNGTAAGHGEPAATPAAEPGPTAAELEFQAELRRSFGEALPPALSDLRAHLQVLLKADNEATQIKESHDMYRRLRALSSNAGLAGLSQTARLADALEALLRELCEKPKSISTSTLRSVAAALDLLALLGKPEHALDPARSSPVAVLVVDDEAISRRAITYALDKAKLKSVSVEDPDAAYSMLAQNNYDLVFLDVDMPGMNGFELCSKLRAMPRHKKTPVVFVTGLNDLESRASSMISGGNDYIVKPFLFVELAVKALAFVLRGQLEVK